MDFRWDPAKAKANLAKHGVDFADAVTSLEHELALSYPDPDAEGEERFVCLGIDALGRLLVTIYTFRDDHIRIISSRKATRQERRRYEDGL